VLAVADDLCRRTGRPGPASVSRPGGVRRVASRMTVTPGALFSAADRAQYVAKRGRLSTTVLTQELGPEPDG
jgi:hypothetical protein